MPRDLSPCLERRSPIQGVRATDGVRRMIQLIGPGGAGKSSAGALLARRLGVAFVDLDGEFSAGVGDISRYLDSFGYAAYARQNVEVYIAVGARGSTGVVALSSGFMTYPSVVHPAYEACRQHIAASASTFVLLPSLDVEACVAETVRRQLFRPFARSPEREAQVMRRRFPIYASMSARKVETMRPIGDVVDAIVAALLYVPGAR